jgi:Uma2 family endonuclease
MKQQLKPCRYTVEEYLSIEESAIERSEYYNGEIFTMAGGTPNHNQISGNLYIELSAALKKADYRVYMADVKLWIPQKNSFTYPDIMIIKGKPQFYNDSKDILLNPVLIVEVLSDSTKNYDKGDKFEHYRSLDSLQDYILVNQDSIHIEHFRKIEKQEWLFTEVSDESNSLNLINLAIELNLTDIYNKVELLT